jgi:hypothetical protein
MKLNHNDAGFAEQLMADININMAELNEAFMKQASLYVYYAYQIKSVSTELGRKRIHLDTMFAKLAKECRKEYVNAGIKPTEKMIENQIFITSSYVALNLSIVDLKTTETLLRDCLEALKHKKDMLVQLSVSQREEIKGGMRMLENPKAVKRGNLF